jgi:hypothetical protein
MTNKIKKLNKILNKKAKLIKDIEKSYKIKVLEIEHTLEDGPKITFINKIEKDENYFKIAETRINNLLNQQSLF